MSLTVNLRNACACIRGTQSRATVLSRARTWYSSHTIRDGRPFRMAVIGSGPAGFYTALRVMQRLDHVVVDMYEHLPVPYGLVRFGVAPDHPEVKVDILLSWHDPIIMDGICENCQDRFAEVASSNRFNFIGNLHIGKDLPISALIPQYNAVVFAYGASKDRKLGIPGEDSLQGIHSARAFVGWYNGLPEYTDLEPELDTGETAVIIGQGNVALDVARTLLSGGDRLRETDITEKALDALSRSRIKRVHVVGRRGPMQASFTIKEVRELRDLPDMKLLPIDKSVLPPDLLKLPRASKRLMQLLSGLKPTAYKDPISRSCSLEFLLSPTSFETSDQDPGHVSSVRFVRNELVGPEPFAPSAKIIPRVSEKVQLPASLVFRSIGYKSEPITGMAELGIEFDYQRGIIPNDRQGRVIVSDLQYQAPENQGTRLYCSGWVKQGPTGVIAGTMEDAFMTAEAIVSDWHNSDSQGSNIRNQEASQKGGWDVLKAEIAKIGVRTVSWDDWQKIDAAEKERGRQRGKEREKFSSVQEMLKVLS